MSDLLARFATLDAIPAPDLWTEIERRAATMGAPAPSAGDPQRLGPATPTWRGAAPVAGRSSGRRLVLVLVLLGLLLVSGVVVGVGSGIIRLPWQSTPQPSALTSEAVIALELQHIEDFSAEVSIPESWQVVPVECCPDFRQYSGTAPEGHLSVSHESPYSVTVCSPDCETVEIPLTIPYAADPQLEALKAGVAAIAGNGDWTELASGVLPEVVGGARLDTNAVASDGREWHRVHVVGLRDRNVVAITWSQPVAAFDERLLEAVLAAIDLPSAPGYSDGDLVELLTGEAGFSMPLPGFWLDEQQPTVDGEALSGVRRYAEGRVLVSIGDAQGTMGWCDPECATLTDLTSLDALEAAVRDGATVGLASDTTLGGEPARLFDSDAAVPVRYVLAMHGDRPVALRIDTGEWDVAPGIVDDMIAGFRFVDPVAEPAEQVITVAGGRAELALSNDWQPSPVTDGMLVNGLEQLTVTVGDARGRIVRCERPAGPWEQCERVRVRTLDELAAAVQPAPIADHGVGPPSGLREAGTLGGEPSVVTRIQAYEYPARSGQEVVYIVAMHAGRPYIVRIWTSGNQVMFVDLESVIAGFRFTD